MRSAAPPRPSRPPRHPARGGEPLRVLTESWQTDGLYGAPQALLHRFNRISDSNGLAGLPERQYCPSVPGPGRAKWGSGGYTGGRRIEQSQFDLLLMVRQLLQAISNPLSPDPSSICQQVCPLPFGALHCRSEAAPGLLRKSCQRQSLSLSPMRPMRRRASLFCSSCARTCRTHIPSQHRRASSTWQTDSAAQRRSTLASILPTGTKQRVVTGSAPELMLAATQHFS